MQCNCEVKGEETAVILTGTIIKSCEIICNTALQLKLTQVQELISAQLEPHQCKVYWAAGLKTNAIRC